MAAVDPTDSARTSDSPSAAGSTSAAGAANLVSSTGSSDAGEVARPTRRHAATVRGRTSGPREDGATGGLGHLGRRFIPREPHRREFAAVLVLVLVACTLSASLPGVWAAHPGSSDPGNQLAANLDFSADPTASASDPIESFEPLPTDVPTYTPPAPSVVLPNGPTPVPTPTPTKAPKPTPRKVYTFVALGDSLTSGYGDSGPSWPSRLDTQDPYLRLLHNAGVPGDLTSGMRSRLSSDVVAYKPDVVFVMGGTNDIGHYVSAATTIANLRAIIVAAKAKGITVVLMTIPPDSYPAWAGQINSLNSQIVHLANSYVLAVVDVHAALSTSDGVYVDKYTVDGVHFSALGAQVVANTVQARVKRYGW